jgi:phosphotransferase system  glucose/maltose/N-acetylglucosamine-specific IIC component
VFALGFGPLLAILPISQSAKEGYAMLLILPITFGAFIAGLVGLVLAIVHRSEWQLGAMGFASVAFVGTFALDEDIMMIAAVFYMVMLISFCGGWFFFRRRKMKEAERSGD